MSLIFEANLAERNFDVALRIPNEQRVGILGPNGSGKSTLLSILAGVLRPDSGYAELDGEVLFDIPSRAAATTPRAGGRALWTKPHTRGVSLLSQDPLLFPHMSVAQNVEFGPQSKKVPPKEARKQAEHWLNAVDVAGLGARKPSELSGGQAQRVAIARALATDPKLLLLDEPMAALDVAVAPQLRRVLRQVLEDQTTLIVTHDLLDAALLCDRVVVLHAGHIVEEGPTDQVLQHPRTGFTAGLAGLNLVRGTYSRGSVKSADGFQIQGTIVSESKMALGSSSLLQETPDGKDPLYEDREVAAMFEPSAVSVFRDIPEGSPRNNEWVTIEDLEPKGNLVTVRGRTDQGQELSADVTLGSVNELGLHPGTRVVFTVKAAAVSIYATDTP